MSRLYFTIVLLFLFPTQLSANRLSISDLEIDLLCDESVGFYSVLGKDNLSQNSLTNLRVSLMSACKAAKNDDAGVIDSGAKLLPYLKKECEKSCSGKKKCLSACSAAEAKQEFALEVFNKVVPQLELCRKSIKEISQLSQASKVSERLAGDVKKIIDAFEDKAVQLRSGRAAPAR